MIKYTKGNLLESQTEALINTVNEVGVMGKGIALMFKEKFPENSRAYEKACKGNEVRVGHMFVFENKELIGPRWIINFPTKKHWSAPSQMQWIRDGLKDLARIIKEKEIKSVALPPLGCGNGGLEWRYVRQEMESTLADLRDVCIIAFEPAITYQNAPKRVGVEELTPARALIADMVRRYSILGIECTNLEVQKLAYFVQRVLSVLKISNPLNLNFSANKYGPYADQLRHLLNGLDGSYLHCEKRLSDAGPFEPIWFEDSKRDAVESYFKSNSAEIYREALEKTDAIIDGFESPLGMELLSTVDWLLCEKKTVPSIESLKLELSKWPGGRDAGRRKLALFDDRLLGLALNRLLKVLPITSAAETIVSQN